MHVELGQDRHATAVVLVGGGSVSAEQEKGGCRKGGAEVGKARGPTNPSR